MDGELLTLSEAARRCAVSASHLRLLAHSGRIEARKLGRDWLTTEAAVRAYLADGEARSKDPYKHRRASGKIER